MRAQIAERLAQDWLKLDFDRWLKPLAIATGIFGLITIYGAFIFAPPDSIQGDVQRIFYIHAPIATFMEVSGVVVALMGLLYLLTRLQICDVIARCSAEICLLFTTIVLLTGSLWGRPVWGTFWAWDARLTFTLILWFIFAGYLMLRAYIGEPEKAARYASVFGIIGAVDIPLIHVAVEWWHTLHPQGIIDSASGSPALPGSMLLVFGLGMITALLLYLLLMGMRIRVELMREAALKLEEQSLDERESSTPVVPSPSSEAMPRQAGQMT